MIKKILIVDDEENILNFLYRLLRRKYKVLLSKSAKEAISTVKKEKIDLVITDLKMPEIDGIELVKNIRRTDSKIGVIVMTGYGNIESYLNSKDLGTFEYLNKPFDNEILLRIIDTMLTQTYSISKELHPLKGRLLSQHDTSNHTCTVG